MLRVAAHSTVKHAVVSLWSEFPGFVQKIWGILSFQFYIKSFLKQIHFYPNLSCCFFSSKKLLLLVVWVIFHLLRMTKGFIISGRIRNFRPYLYIVPTAYYEAPYTTVLYSAAAYWRRSTTIVYLVCTYLVPT